MNYVAHTRAAHEHLSRQAQARPHHVSLYWALFFEWNAARFPLALDLDHAATMRAARIGNERTYRAALYDLDTWQLLTYQPSQSRYERSRCHLTDFSQPLTITGSSAPDESPAPEAELPPMHPPTGGISARHENAASGAELPPALRAQVPPMKPASGAEVPEDTLYGKTRGLNSVVENGTGGHRKKKIEVLEGEGLSSAELVDEPVPPHGAGPVPPSSAARKKKAGRPPAIPPHEPRHRGRPGRRPEVPFAESYLARYEDFAAAFAGTDYALADLRFYHAQILNWRKNGEPPRRRDWKATATQFFLNDAHDNRLKLAPPAQFPNDGSGPGTLFARTGFRSKYDT
ncbi:hypothetical protein [Hymenobacter terrestris]|uniref:DUF1376 domain-containing protein n=1 Tax=Hymenobacter terrestris TaxID=2748310 RepID=A0ABX2Q026_9BACT|nr:hypothetical protein [Hymenobacter terrestris]NVO84274.1 hypothetical protein [Hymenobacter terrestris]